MNRGTKTIAGNPKVHHGRNDLALTRTLHNACNRGHGYAQLLMQSDNLVLNGDIADRKSMWSARDHQVQIILHYGSKAYHDATFTTTPRWCIFSLQHWSIFGFRLEITK